MGAPLGNQNGRNHRIFRDSLRRILATYEDKENKIKRGQALDKINTGLVQAAINGDEWAVKEVANRTDGKPVQVQDIEVSVTAKSVVGVFIARLGADGTREMLKASKAANLIPVLDQLLIEQSAGNLFEQTG